MEIKPYYENPKVLFWIGCVFFGVIALSFTSMPGEWRSNIMPKIDEGMARYDEVDKKQSERSAKLEREINELTNKVMTVKADLKAHTSRAHVYAERPEK